MEYHPKPSPNEEPRGPELERLWPGEIDLTGVVRQDDSLADVIGDAITEADGGLIPDWGARSLARALANERRQPTIGALHHYAVTGRIDMAAIAGELIELYEATDPDDSELRDWINRLGTYIIHQPDPADLTDPDTTEQPSQPVGHVPIEQASTYLRIKFTEADARGEPITDSAAQIIAALLARQLEPDSQMQRFADTGDANPALLHEECRELNSLTWHSPEVNTWIQRLQQHVAARTDLGRDAELTPAPEDSPDTPEVEQGIRAHGDAFRAFLQLSDIDPTWPDLGAKFTEFYVGTYDSMDDLTTALVGGVDSEAELLQQAIDGVTFGELVHAGWDIIPCQGRLHVFMKQRRRSM